MADSLIALIVGKIALRCFSILVDPPMTEETVISTAARSSLVSVEPAIRELKERLSKIAEIPRVVSNLDAELESLKGFLGDARDREEDDLEVKQWIIEIEELHYEAEEITKRHFHRILRYREIQQGCWDGIKHFPRALHDRLVLAKEASEIYALTKRISLMTSKMKAYGIVSNQNQQAAESTATEDPPIPSTTEPVASTSCENESENETIIVGRGMQEDIKTIEKQLIHEASTRVVGICGANGIGKTTLAKEVFRSRSVADHFDVVAWAFVGPEFCVVEVLKEILWGLLENVDEEENHRIIDGPLGEDFLSEIISQILVVNRCLVVLDDFQTTATWDCLQTAFSSIKSTDSSSKLVLTTCDARVPSYVDSQGFLHQLRFLNSEEKWQLLLNETGSSGKDIRGWLMKRKVMGKPLIEHCVGLPLTIQVLAGFYTRHLSGTIPYMIPYALSTCFDALSRKDSRNVFALRECGDRSILELEVEEVLKLCDKALYLEPKLRSCLQGMLHYREGLEIPTEALFSSWIHKGVVKDTIWSTCTAEEEAQRCLDKLVKRRLVQVVDKDSSGKIMSCQLHSLVRDFYCNLRI